MDGHVTWSDLGISFGRTLSEHSAATQEKTSTPCWKKLRVSQNQDFLYLDCRKSGNGQKQEPLTVMGGLSLGELTTLKTGEKPSETAVQEMLSVWGPHSVAEESRLSQILEANPLPKYKLTAKACLGILRRAERRGKDLPERLKAVLLMQSELGGGCDGGGKGALVQEDKSGTLGIGNDQTIFTPTAYSFDSLASNSMKSKNPHSGCREVDVAKTLDTTVPTPSKNQGGIAVVAPAVALDMTHVCDVIRECGETNGTLQAKSNGGTSYNLQNTGRTGMIVRRLTPIECERLQGFPDGWTDIGEWRDSKGKLRKPSDSPRYKACGNSIALPFWDFLAKRISAQYLRSVTMGSLFDGIGGFPLVFERHNGKGTARWASEIEEFPIAVTKKWFGEG